MALEILTLNINNIVPGLSTRVIALPQGKYFVGPLAVLPGRLDVVVTGVALSPAGWTNNVLLTVSLDSAETDMINLPTTVVCSDEHVIGGDGGSVVEFDSSRSFDMGA